MDNFLIASGILSPAVATIIVKWFLTSYEKRGEKIEKDRQDHFEKEISTVEGLVRRLGADIDRLKENVTRTDKDLAVMVEKLKFQASDVSNLLKAFRDFVGSNGKRLSTVESQVTEISKDLFLVTSKKKGDK